MIRKHLFLRLYKDNFRGVKKPLSYYAKDFDKNEKVFFNILGDKSYTTEKKFRNLDELFLTENAFFNLIFAFKYLSYYQSIDTHSNKSIQEIFELSLLSDNDEKPNDEGFKFAYFSDSKREELIIYRKLNILLLWKQLGISDLEFSRRIEECLVNVIPSSGIASLSDGLKYKNPFIDYKKSNTYVTKSNNIVDDLKVYQNKLSELEKKFTDSLDMPKTVLFDGTRFTIIIPKSPISLMFDIKNPKIYNIGGKKNSNCKVKDETRSSYTGGISIIHPTSLQPAFIDRKKSERCGSWWNGRSAWDYTWKEVIDKAILDITNSTNTKGVVEKLELISFILLLKNGGKIKKSGFDIIDLIVDYRDERNKIVKEYNNVVEAQKELASTLFHSYRNRKPVNIIFKCVNGYAVVNYKRYKLSEEKKLDSSATFYNENLKKIGVSSFYTDNASEYNDAYKRKVYDGGRENKLKLKKAIVSATFLAIFKSSNILSIDYKSDNERESIKRYNKLLNNDGTHTLNNYIMPVEVITSRLNTIYTANSINTYATKLQEQINKIGYVDVNEYSKSIEIIENGIANDFVYSSNYDLDIDTGAKTKHNKKRFIVQYNNMEREYIDTEFYSSFFEHVQYQDVKYHDIMQSETYTSQVNDFDRLEKTTIIDHDPNYLNNIRGARKVMIKQKATETNSDRTRLNYPKNPKNK